ncbi:hypothetical protein CWB96_19095, partial [Pseudoalteromonas citrea]
EPELIAETDELDIENIDGLLNEPDDEFDIEEMDELLSGNEDATTTSNLSDDIAGDLLDEVDDELLSETNQHAHNDKASLTESDFDIDDLDSPDNGFQADTMHVPSEDDSILPTSEFEGDDKKNGQSIDELLNALDDSGDSEWDDELAEGDEIDLGDDPLLEGADLSEIEEFDEPDLVTPSAELDSYPELELDSEFDETPLSASETEQALSDALQNKMVSENALEGELDDSHGDDDLDLSFEDDEATPNKSVIEDVTSVENEQAEQNIEDLPEFNEQDALDSMDEELEELSASEFESLLQAEDDLPPQQEANLNTAQELAGIAESSELEAQSADLAVSSEMEEPLETLPEFDEQAALDAVADEPEQPLETEIEDELDVDSALENTLEDDFEEDAVIEPSELDTQSTDEEIGRS